jgi:hypothetical protein
MDVPLQWGVIGLVLVNKVFIDGWVCLTSRTVGGLLLDLV